MVKKQFLIFLTLLFFDQVSKIIVNTTNLSIDFKILAITLVKNTGAVWGSFKDSNVAFIWISLIAVGVLMHSYDEFPKKSYPFLLLLFAGIIGNLIDRLFRGYVIDFINFKIWPVFNFADTYITIGVLGLIVYMWNEKN